MSSVELTPITVPVNICRPPAIEYSAGTAESDQIFFDGDRVTCYKAMEGPASSGGMRRAEVMTSIDRRRGNESRGYYFQVDHALDPEVPIHASYRFQTVAHEGRRVPTASYGVLDIAGGRNVFNVHLPTGTYFCDGGGFISTETLHRHANHRSSFEWVRTSFGHILMAVKHIDTASGEGFQLSHPVYPEYDKNERAIAYWTVNATMPMQGVENERKVEELIQTVENPLQLHMELAKLGYDVRLTREEEQAAAIQFLRRYSPSSDNDGEEGYDSEYAMG